MATLTPPTDPVVEELKRKLLFAKFKYFAWTGGVLFVLLVICLPPSSEAARTTITVLGTKLSKTPIVGPLFSGRSMAKLDGATVAAIVIYTLVIYFWRELLRFWLDPSASTELNEGPYRTLITCCAFAVLLIDLILMYIGISALSWGKVTFSLLALLFTLIYGVGLVFASLVSMNLKRTIKKLEEEL